MGDETKPLLPENEAPPGGPGTGETVCPECAGSGRVGGELCPACAGAGVVTANRGES